MNQQQENETPENTATSNNNPATEEQQENNSNKETEELKAKYNELNDKYLRLYSDFDNYRKRTAKEKSELILSGGEDVFKILLPVLDDFERAIKSNTEINDAAAIKEGINLIYNKLKNSLTQRGLTEMKAAGEVFNTDLHEAITNIPAPSDDMKGKVIDEVEKGYTLNGKVIRFAKVVIGN